MTHSATGHRGVPHTADLRIEAWAPTRNGCIRQAMLGAVESFVDTSSAHPDNTYRSRFSPGCDDDLLAAVLDEVIYLLDTEGQVAVDVDLDDVDGDVAATFATVEATTLPQIGSIPKAVSFNELRLARQQQGWRCSVTLDV